MDILLIGFGSIGQRHYQNLQKMGFEPEIISRHLHKTKPQKERYDLVMICSETSRRLRDIKTHRHLSESFFIEKPLATSSAEGKKIATLLKNKKVIIGYVLLCHPIIAKVKQLLDRKVIGEIFLAQLHAGYFLPKWRPKTDYKKSYSADNRRGGGVALDLIHEINYAQYLFSPATAKIIGLKRKVSDLFIKSEDIACFGLLTRDKYINITVNYLDQTLKRQIDIFGTKGKLTANLVANVIQLTNTDHRQTQKVKVTVGNMYLQEMKMVIKIVKEDLPIPPAWAVRQGITDLTIITHAIR